MGQRLIINIKNNGIVVASGYYHWGAATQPAIAIIKDMVEAIQEEPELIAQPFNTLAAIRLLKTTGAGLVKEDFPIALEQYPSNNDIVAAEDRFTGLINRSDGLISITEESMARAEEDSVGDATLDVGTSTIDMGGMVFQYDDLNEYNEVNEQDEDDEEPIKEESLKISDLTFDEFLTLSDTVEQLVKDGFKVAKQPDGTLIELVE